jgi:2,3-dihydroxybenzoate decarboxylase
MMQGKIALEEHVFLPSFGAYGADPSALDGATKAHNYDPKYFADVQKRLGDATLRLEDMDRCGIECIVLSLTQPGIQGIPDHAIAVDTAKRMNDGSGRASFGGTSEPICRLRCCRPPGRARGW